MFTQRKETKDETLLLMEQAKKELEGNENEPHGDFIVSICVSAFRIKCVFHLHTSANKQLANVLIGFL